MLAAEVLTGEGFVTMEANDAAAAIAIFESRASEVDVLFTDIQMPGSMDGVALAHHVRERSPSIAVVIASGNLSVKTEEFPAGARFMPKPYDMTHIVELMRELCPRP